MSRTHLSTVARRALRTRKKLGKGSAARPRVTVFRSNTALSAQAIDDAQGITLTNISTRSGKTYTLESCQEAGKQMAQDLQKAKVETILFDRGPYQYHGKVKAFAEGLREGGMQF